MLGVDPQQAGRRWRERTGVVLQEAGFVENSKRELLRLHAGCYPRPPPVAEVIALTGFDEKAGSKVKTLSGDQRWRFNLALALGIQAARKGQGAGKTGGGLSGAVASV